MVGTVKYRDSIEYRDTFSRYVSWHKISGIAQHYSLRRAILKQSQLNLVKSKFKEITVNAQIFKIETFVKFP